MPFGEQENRGVQWVLCFEAVWGWVAERPGIRSKLIGWLAAVLHRVRRMSDEAVLQDSKEFRTNRSRLQQADSQTVSPFSPVHFASFLQEKEDWPASPAQGHRSGKILRLLRQLPDSLRMTGGNRRAGVSRAG